MTDWLDIAGRIVAPQTPDQPLQPPEAARLDPDELNNFERECYELALRGMDWHMLTETHRAELTGQCVAAMLAADGLAHLYDALGDISGSNLLALFQTSTRCEWVASGQIVQRTFVAYFADTIQAEIDKYAGERDA